MKRFKVNVLVAIEVESKDEIDALEYAEDTFKEIADLPTMWGTPIEPIMAVCFTEMGDTQKQGHGHEITCFNDLQQFGHARISPERDGN